MRPSQETLAIVSLTDEQLAEAIRSEVALYDPDVSTARLETLALEAANRLKGMPF